MVFVLILRFQFRSFLHYQSIRVILESDLPKERVPGRCLHCKPTSFLTLSCSFELVLRFCYGERLHMSPGNIAALRCAAEYLEMTEDYSPPGHLNLLMLTDAFLDRVALRTTTDALHVLLGCQVRFAVCWPSQLLRRILVYKLIDQL